MVPRPTRLLRLVLCLSKYVKIALNYSCLACLFRGRKYFKHCFSAVTISEVASCDPFLSVSSLKRSLYYNMPCRHGTLNQFHFNNFKYAVPFLYTNQVVCTQCVSETLPLKQLLTMSETQQVPSGPFAHSHRQIIFFHVRTPQKVPLKACSTGGGRCDTTQKKNCLHHSLCKCDKNKSSISRIGAPLCATSIVNATHLQHDESEIKLNAYPTVPYPFDHP